MPRCIRGTCIHRGETLLWEKELWNRDAFTSIPTQSQLLHLKHGGIALISGSGCCPFRDPFRPMMVAAHYDAWSEVAFPVDSLLVGPSEANCMTSESNNWSM